MIACLFCIETFYFISLAVICGLIVLLIFHFRNKIIHLEKQLYSLHGIATELVAEVKTQQQQQQQPTNFLKEFMPFLTASSAQENMGVDKYEDESDEESEYMGDSEVINLGETMSIDQVGLIEESVPVNDVSSVNDVLEPLVNDVSSVNDVSEPLVNDLSEPSVNDVSEPLVNEVSDLLSAMDLEDTKEDDAHTVTTNSETNYKKMTVTRLRDIAAEKGFAPASNKLKKDELVKLLSGDLRTE